MRAKELFDGESPMNRAAVPQQENVSAQVSKQGMQESNHLIGGNVGKVKVNIQSEPMASRRDGERRNGRDSVVPVPVMKVRCLPLGCPRLADIRDKHEAAFIQKGQMGTKFASVFLYPAIRNVSSARWPLRFVRTRVAPASGNSTPFRSATPSIHAQDGSERRIRSGSFPRSASMSTRRSSIPPPVARAPAVSPMISFPSRITGTVGREQVLLVSHVCPCAGMPATNARQNSGRTLPPVRPLESGRHGVASSRPADAGLPIRQNFRWVSCTIN